MLTINKGPCFIIHCCMILILKVHDLMYSNHKNTYDYTIGKEVFQYVINSNFYRLENMH